MPDTSPTTSVAEAKAARAKIAFTEALRAARMAANAAGRIEESVSAAPGEQMLADIEATNAGQEALDKAETLISTLEHTLATERAEREVVAKKLRELADTMNKSTRICDACEGLPDELLALASSPEGATT